MMKTYTIDISSVDGESFFYCRSNSKKVVKEFVKRYDHEGSSKSLDIKTIEYVGGPTNIESYDDNEEIGRILEII